MACPVFRPTAEEFCNFYSYICTIESKFRDIGICKIIPPKGWFDFDYTTLSDSDYPTIRPIQQFVSGKRGIFELQFVELPPMTFSEFKTRAIEADSSKPDTASADDTCRAFWKRLNTFSQAPMYGADTPGSLFKNRHNGSWNVDCLNTPLQQFAPDIPGITRSMLYFGMWRAMFAFHKEDMDLFSINYIHFGAPKSWYCLSPKQARRFETLAAAYFGEAHRQCDQFLRHKTSMISPQNLKANNIPYVTVTQEPGEFIVTFPSAYHAGFNQGFNCAESVNFITPSWIPFGKAAKLCRCRPDFVRLDMAAFETWYHCQSTANDQSCQSAGTSQTGSTNCAAVHCISTSNCCRPRVYGRVGEVVMVVTLSGYEGLATVVAVQGEGSDKMVRLRLQGRGVDCDEWHPVTSSRVLTTTSVPMQTLSPGLAAQFFQASSAATSHTKRKNQHGSQPPTQVKKLKSSTAQSSDGGSIEASTNS